MSEKKKADAAPEEGAAPSKPRGSMMGKLVVALFMGMIILTEVIAFYLLFPNAEHVATIAEEKIAKKLATHVADKNEEKEEHSDTDQIEVDLGGFDITAHQPAANVTMRISFHLYATISEADKGKFESLKTSTEHRLRDKIIYEIRNSEVADITDPGLGLIKRRILEKSNELFGKQILRSVIFSDFSFVEQ